MNEETPLTYDYNLDNNKKKIHYKPKKKLLNECLLYCSLTVISLFIVTFALGFAVFLVYTSLALHDTTNNSIQEKCVGNYIWYNILLVALVGSIIILVVIKNKFLGNDDVEVYETSRQRCYNLCKELSLLIINYMLIFWLDNNISDTCFKENFSETKLFIVSYMYLYLYFIICLSLVLVIIFECFMTCCVTYKDNKQVKDVKNSNIA